MQTNPSALLHYRTDRAIGSNKESLLSLSESIQNASEQFPTAWSQKQQLFDEFDHLEIENMFFLIWESWYLFGGVLFACFI